MTENVSSRFQVHQLILSQHDFESILFTMLELDPRY